MGLFTPGFASQPFGAPQFITLGALQINGVSDNSNAVVGRFVSGDYLSIRKLNNGFGLLFGNANLVPSCLNLVIDPDGIDQFSPQNQVRTSFGSVTS